MRRYLEPMWQKIFALRFERLERRGEMYAPFASA